MKYKRSHFKIELELPFQRNCLAGLMPQASVLLKQGKITFTGPKATLHPKEVCKDTKKADMTMDLNF